MSAHTAVGSCTAGGLVLPQCSARARRFVCLAAALTRQGSAVKSLMCFVCVCVCVVHVSVCCTWVEDTTMPSYKAYGPGGTATPVGVVGVWLGLQRLHVCGTACAMRSGRVQLLVILLVCCVHLCVSFCTCQGIM